MFISGESTARYSGIGLLRDPRAEQIEADGSMLVLEKDPTEMSRHAEEQGWIEPVGIEEVAGEKMKESTPRS